MNDTRQVGYTSESRLPWVQVLLACSNNWFFIAPEISLTNAYPFPSSIAIRLDSTRCSSPQGLLVQKDPGSLGASNKKWPQRRLGCREGTVKNHSHLPGEIPIAWSRPRAWVPMVKSESDGITACWAWALSLHTNSITHKIGTAATLAVVLAYALDCFNARTYFYF